MHEIVDRLRRELCDGVCGLSAEEMQLRREVKRWNIQQIVEHLLLSYETTSKVVLARVEKGSATKAKPSIAQRFGQMMIVKLRIFPKGRVAPAAVDPGDCGGRVLRGEEMEERIGEALSRMDGALAAAETLFGPSQRAISHLVLGPMSVSEWRKFHLVHGEHHLKQIAATRILLR